MTTRRGAFTATIVRTARGPLPRMGDAGADTVTRVSVPGCMSYPNTVTETVSRKTGTESSTPAQDTVVFGLTVLMPAGTDVRASDQVEVAGVLYDVNGEPSKWKSPSTGHRSCTEVQLKGAEG